MSDELHVLLVRERPGNDPECFRLYICRDKEPHCAAQRKSNPTKACASCVRPDESLTLEQVIAQLQRGDA